MFLVVSVVALAADLGSKHVAFRSLLDDPALAPQVRAGHAMGLEPHEILARLHVERHVMPGLRLTLSTNRGVVFGLRPHRSPTVRRWIIGVATVLCTALVGVFFATSPRRASWTHIALALILAGALGNLYDRLLGSVVLPGLPEAPIRHQVRDFINCSDLYWPYVFNIADVWLVVGVGMMVLAWARSTMTSRRDAPSDTASDVSGDPPDDAPTGQAGDAST